MSKNQRFGNVVVWPTAERATWHVAEQVKHILCQAVEQREICYVALAGGTTPHGLYLTLAGAAISGEVPWQHVEVFFGDERDVPHDHVESNYRMAQRTLLDHVPIQPQRVHPMPADADDLGAAAADYERTIRQAVPAGDDGLPAFDLVLLGMGGEGHVASLFPDTEAIAESKRLVTSYHVPMLGRDRMTFTFPLINAARNVLLLVIGEDKAQAVGRLLGDDDSARSQLPASRVARPNSTLVLDAAAARVAGLKPQEA